MSVQIVVTGNNVKDIANRMRELADEMYKPKSLKAAAVEEEDEDELEEDTTEDDDDSEEDEEDTEEAEEEEQEDDEENDGGEGEDEEEKPAKAAKKVKGKAKKLTANDVNDACKKLASSIGGKEGRKKVLSILKKKFKTESVSELKPTDYARCIEAMADAE